MTKDQEKAIRYVIFMSKTINFNKSGFPYGKESLETVLNMLKENSAEIQQKNTELAEKNAEIEKLRKHNKELLRKLRNRVKEVKKLQKNPNYKAIVTKQGKTLEERAEQIKKYKQLYNKALDDAVITAHDNMKKDKMIDLMAEEIKKRATCPLDDYNYDLDCENKCNNNTKECWKQYFERKESEYYE